MANDPEPAPPTSAEALSFPPVRREFSFVLLLGALGVTGCGSSPTSTAAFTTQLNTLCTQGNAAVRGAGSVPAAANTALATRMGATACAR